MNKTQKIIILVAAILLALAAAYLLFIRKGDDKVLAKVPIDSKSVMVIDVRALSSKLFLDDLGTDVKNSAKAIAKLLPDSLSDINWSANGLGLPDKIALFTLEDTVNGSSSYSINFIVPIFSAKKFNLFISGISAQLKVAIANKGNFNWWYLSNLGLLVVWDDHFAIGRLTAINNDTNVNQLIHVLSAQKSQSILADTCFTKKLAAKYDVLIYSKPYQKCPVKKLEPINSSMVYCTSSLNFNKGELEIISEIKTKEGSLLDKIFVPIGEEMSCLANTGSSIVNLFLQINPEAFMQLYHQYKPIDFKPGIPYSKAWDGRINLALLGNRTVENEYITYEYDDNFNKVAIKTRKQEKILDIQAIIGNNKIKNDSIVPIKNGLDSLLFKGGNFVMRKTRSYYLMYNKLFTKPEIAKKAMKSNIEMEINYKSLMPILKDLGITGKTEWLDSIACEKIVLKANKKGPIHITLLIQLADKERNSFYAISEKIGQKQIGK